MYVVVTVVVCDIFEQARAAIGIEYLVAFECGTSTNVFLSQWITGIPYRNVFIPDVERSNGIRFIFNIQLRLPYKENYANSLEDSANGFVVAVYLLGKDDGVYIIDP